MTPQWRIVSRVVAVLFATVFTVFAVKPGDLRNNLNDWLGFVGGIDRVLLIVLGAAVGAALHWLYRGRNQPHLAPLVTKKEYHRAIQEVLETEKYPVIKVFGYTGEIVLENVFQFEDRSRSIAVRVLQRNWLIEEQEQQAHNQQSQANKAKPWDKARVIRETADRPWEHAMRREIHYYDGPPQVRGMLMCDQGGQAHIGYFGFFEWQDGPPTGGSPFKGVADAYVALHSDIERQRVLLNVLNSQFDLMWSRSKTAEELRSQQASAR